MLVISLIATVIIIFASCLLALQLYDLFTSDLSRTLIVLGYCLFVLSMLIYWFFDNLKEFTF